MITANSTRGNVTVRSVSEKLISTYSIGVLRIATSNSAWRTAPNISIRIFLPIYVNMAQRSGSLTIGNNSENAMEPLLSEKMDSASQSSRKHSRTRSTLSSRVSTSASAQEGKPWPKPLQRDKKRKMTDYWPRKKGRELKGKPKKGENISLRGQD